MNLTMVNIRESAGGNMVSRLTITPDGLTRALKINLRRLVRTDKWYISITDISTGEELLHMAPLVSCTPQAFNDIFRQFEHLGIGSMAVFAAVEDALNRDPATGTLDDFSLIWGNYYEPES